MTLTKTRATAFIVLMGIVSLFADITYEGARSIIGPYLAVLGATGAIVGLVAGLGECVGYVLRLVFGYLTDKTQRYWLILLIGYVINLIAVPLMALTTHWPTVAALVVCERLGKAVRIPARDALLSHASHEIGMGWGFGLHEALDKIGAMLGPFLIAFILFLQKGYRFGFAILAIPAIFALITLLIAYFRYHKPMHLSVTKTEIHTSISTKNFWFFMMGCAFIAFGYADFPLIAFHFEKNHILTPVLIPIAYGIALGINAITAPIAGKLYDKLGLWVLMGITIITASFAPLVFLGGALSAFIGVGIWAIGMGTQQSIMRAVVGNLVPSNKRASAYGLFNMIFGLTWFAGSALSGLIYDHTIPWLVAFIILAQLLALPFLLLARQS